MKVCMLTTSFPRWPGDLSGNFIESLCTCLAKRGVGIEVVAPGHREAQGYETRPGISISRFKYAIPARLQVVAYDGGIPYKLRTSNLARLELVQFMVSMLRAALAVASRCDIVHAHWIPTGVLASLVSRRLDIPMVLTVHGSDGKLLKGGAVKRIGSRFSLTSADRIITVSDALKAHVLEFEPKVDAVVRTIHNGVELSDFPFVRKASNARRLLWVGRMTEEKGVDYLIHAMKKVVSSYPDASLRLVGDGPLRSDLETLTNELDLRERVEFAGESPHSELSEMYAWCDLVVMPSLSEGLPTVLPEAMATGRPVVASRVGGIPELLKHGETGYLVSPERVDELAGSIIELLGKPDLMEKMGAASHELVESTHSWGAIASDTHSVYLSLGKER